MRIIRNSLIALVMSGGFLVAAPVAAHGEGAEELTKCVEEAAEAKTDAAECQEAPNAIVPATDELLWGGLAFLALLAAMAKYGYPAVKKTMDTRTDKIRGDLDEAERVRAEASTILEEYQRQLADAKSEANRIIEESRQTAEQMRKDLVTRAEAEAADLRSRAQSEIDSAKDRTLADLREEVAGIAIDLAEKVVGHNLNKETNNALIEQYIEQVGSK